MYAALLRLGSRMGRGSLASSVGSSVRCIATPGNPFLEGQSKTVLETMEHTGAYPRIQNYSPVGFTISNRKVFGPICVLPFCFMQWKVMRKEDICGDALSVFALHHPRIEILVLGLGDGISRLDPSVKERLLAEGIGVEITSTPHACSTFNFLMSEGRVAAAALIPVTRAM